VGRERLPREGPFVLAANHPHYADGFVLATAAGLRGDVRFYVARGNLTWGRGLGAAVLGPCGIICVDLTPGCGGPALRSGLRLLSRGTTVALFPEGWAQMDGRRGAFKPGALHLSRLASRLRGATVPIVPVRFDYGRLPGPWIRRFAPATQYVLALAGFARYRRGVTVTFGAPVSPAEFPVDDAEATRWLEAETYGL
jgi:1-acyl-sn-glycerol-3-phosphate acyltransferase